MWSLDELPPELKAHPMLKDITNDTGNSTKAVVHGILASSLFSSIFGTLCPGAIYIKQSLDFKRVILADELVIGRVDVVRVRQFKARGVIVTCDTSITRGETVCINGKADVWLPGSSKAN